MRYITLLTNAYTAAANPVNAAAMKRYMRDQFAYFGIKTPDRMLSTFRSGGLLPVSLNALHFFFAVGSE